MKKKALAIIMIITVLSLLLAGCAKPAPTVTVTKPAPAVTVTAPAPAPAPVPAPAPTPKPAWKAPRSVSVILGSTTSVAYVSGMALLSTIEAKTKVMFFGVPTDLAVGRGIALKDGTAHFAFMPALSTLNGLEGKGDFEGWKPQSFRAVWIGGPTAGGIAARGNSGVTTMASLKGRKVARYPTYPTMQLYVAAGLAYGGLTYADVIGVDVPSWGKGAEAVIAGTAEAAYFSVLASVAYDLEASIHRIYWIPMPNKTAEDKAAWERYRKMNPVMFPYRMTKAPGASEAKPIDVWAYNYHVTAYDDLDANLAYWFTKQVHENYAAFKVKHENLVTWDIETALQPESWFTPWHEGSVRYFRDIGRWTPEMEKKQQELLAQFPQTMTRLKD